MSMKTDDVLDNWEEIDENGLNTKLDQLKKDASKNSLAATSQQNGNNSMLLLQDEEFRNQLMMPEPTVKILKRPTQKGAREANDQKPKAPVKTLQQREQEYAEARLRILGSAKSPEDDQAMTNPAPPMKLQPQVPNHPPPPIHMPPPPMNVPLMQQMQQMPPRYRPGPRGPPPPPQAMPPFNNSYPFGPHYGPMDKINNFDPRMHFTNGYNMNNLTNSMQQMRPGDCYGGVTRVPRGPDGTKGFMIRR